MLGKKIHSEAVDVFPRNGRFRDISYLKNVDFAYVQFFHQQYTSYLSHARNIETMALLYKQKLCQRWDFRNSATFILHNVQYFWKKGTVSDPLSKVNYCLPEAGGIKKTCPDKACRELSISCLPSLEDFFSPVSANSASTFSSKDPYHTCICWFF